MITCWHDRRGAGTGDLSMKRKAEQGTHRSMEPLVTFSVRIPASLIKRTKLAATLLEIPMQVVVSRSLHAWLDGHESAEQGLLLGRHAKRMKITAPQEGRS